MLQRILVETANRTIPFRKGNSRPTPLWWDEELRDLKREVIAAYRTWECNREEVHKDEYKRLRNQYTMTLRNKKQASWEKFANFITLTTGENAIDGQEMAPEIIMHWPLRLKYSIKR